MRNFYGYIRVSTVKQGLQGVSLQEQKDAILRYSQRSGIEITAWFEEQETAAKQGRPVFNKMLKQLRAGKAEGVVLHKIDRGARNLKDWASIADLNDQGIDVHLANDGLDMKSRGGRLSADIQAVIAADYIRNLREETLKGFYGRLKQGLLPLPSPIGYVDNGKGKPKTPNPIMAPLIRQAFELYSTGHYSIDTLLPELHKLGLRNKRGGKVSRNGLSTILNNHFYVGLIHIYSTDEIFKGIHTPIIPMPLFNRVKNILENKTNTKILKHPFMYRRLISCNYCGRILTGEKQKGHHYYRCHNNACFKTSMREEVIDTAISDALKPFKFTAEEISSFKNVAADLKANWKSQELEQKAGLQLRIGQIRERLNRLTDALLDGTIDRTTYSDRKNALVIEQKQVEDSMATLSETMRTLPDRACEMFELASTAWDISKMGNPDEKRELLKIISSNLKAEGKTLYMTMASPYSELSKQCDNAYGRQERDMLRIWEIIISALRNGQECLKDMSIRPVDLQCRTDLAA